jgi:hypothetical protein
LINTIIYLYQIDPENQSQLKMIYQVDGLLRFRLVSEPEYYGVSHGFILRNAGKTNPKAPSTSSIPISFGTKAGK